MESADYFRPLPPYEGGRVRGCFLCEHRGGRHVIGSPQLGCAFWECEPGADDE